MTGSDGGALAAYKVSPKGPSKGVVQIAHGMSEHFGRYLRLADRLTEIGYTVYGADHRGHGHSSDAHGLGEFGPGGFQTLVDDMALLAGVARKESPGGAFVLFGHSMGSFASQLYLAQHPEGLDALVLSGTGALDKFLEVLLASGGPVSLELLNAGFEPGRTKFDWLSRDEAEVDAYLADPLCGFAVGESSMASMFGLAAQARFDPRLKNVPKNLPIYIISGEMDPVVGPEQANVRALIESWRAAGMGNITHHIYPGGRHEMLNEINRKEVEDDLVGWLAKVIV